MIPAGIVSLAGKFTTPRAFAFRLTRMLVCGVSPPSVRVMFCTAPTAMVNGLGDMLRLVAICTDLTSPVKPGELAVTFADPRLTPVIWAGMLGVVAPPAIKTVGVTVSLVVSLLCSVIVAPPTGAGVKRVTLNGVLAPTATVAPEASEIAPNGAIVTPAEPDV